MLMETGRAVAARYGLGAAQGPPEYADRGERGRIWRLITDRGRWAVKESDEPLDPADAERDVAFQEAAAAAGVPLPRPVRTTAGRVLLPGAEAHSPAAALRVYEWVDLVPGATVRGAEIGALAARVHGLDRPPPGPVHPWFAEPMGPTAWAALIDVAAAAGAWWAAPLGRLLPDLAALDDLVTPPDPAATRTCHRDLNIENVRRLGERPTGHRAGDRAGPGAGTAIVLDWENCGALEPARELATIVVHLREDASEEAALSAYAGYLRADGPTRVTGPGDFSTAIVLQGHLLRHYGERSLDPTVPAEDRRRLDGRVRAALDRPLTPAVVERLLVGLEKLTAYA
jgi:Ser/Thr protein kinase RdoA (MazF antagonist)